MCELAHELQVDFVPLVRYYFLQLFYRICLLILARPRHRRPQILHRVEVRRVRREFDTGDAVIEDELLDDVRSELLVVVVEEIPLLRRVEREVKLGGWEEVGGEDLLHQRSVHVVFEYHHVSLPRCCKARPHVHLDRMGDLRHAVLQIECLTDRSTYPCSSAESLTVETLLITEQYTLPPRLILVFLSVRE